MDNYSKRGASHTASFEEKNDVFSRSQNHWNSGFKREMGLVGNYQKMLDTRLSKPKSLQKYSMGRAEKVYKNTAATDQHLHQSVFTRRNGATPTPNHANG